jgi:AbrB family looped-hinge helix DNA binding protein
MLKLKVTSKRQVTFPRKICDTLGIQEGDEIMLQQRLEEGREVWQLVPQKANNRPWLGMLNTYGQKKSHDMASIRKSIIANKPKQ